MNRIDRMGRNATIKAPPTTTIKIVSADLIFLFLSPNQKNLHIDIVHVLCQSASTNGYYWLSNLHIDI